MPIEPNQIKIMKSQVISDTSSNGGRMSEVEVASGVKNNLWPDVPGSERTNGSTKFRKVFVKVASPDNLKLIDARIFVETPTPGGDRVVLFTTANGQTDTQADVASLVTLFYGSGQLNADVNAGATTVTVIVEDQTDWMFNPNQLIRISNKISVDDPSGTEEFLRIKNDASGVNWNGNLATLTLADGTTLANAYQTTNTRVAPVIEAGELWARTDNWALSSPAGTVAGWNGSGTIPDTLTGSRMVDAIAGIEQTWTITFTNATTFACVGDTVGSVGGGTTTAEFAPTHATWSRPYFTLPASLWGGTWAAGNVLTFRTHPAVFPVWEKRITPPNTGSLSGNEVIIGISAESE
ncbi:MAG: hypothetical protein HQL81_16150 [Magnetococcales bacterium]|nr:hypothetical protein [Magnetococcales bacterium]